MARTRVSFSASGYGSETHTFKSKEEAVESVKRDAAEIAADHGGEVVDYGNGESGSSGHGIFQARILEWGAISYSRGSSRPRD